MLNKTKKNSPRPRFLDGFIEGINGEIDWCIMDEDIKFISS